MSLFHDLRTAIGFLSLFMASAVQAVGGNVAPSDKRNGSLCESAIPDRALATGRGACPSSSEKRYYSEGALSEQLVADGLLRDLQNSFRCSCRIQGGDCRNFDQHEVEKFEKATSVSGPSGAEAVHPRDMLISSGIRSNPGQQSFEDVTLLIATFQHQQEIAQSNAEPTSADQSVRLPQSIGAEEFGGFDVLAEFEGVELGRYLRNSAPRGGEISIGVFVVKDTQRIALGPVQTISFAEAWVQVLKQDRSELAIRLIPRKSMPLKLTADMELEIDYSANIEFLPLLVSTRGLTLKGSLKMRYRDWSAKRVHKVPLTTESIRY